MPVSHEELVEFGLIDQYLLEKKKKLACQDIDRIPDEELHKSRLKVFKTYNLDENNLIQWCSSRNVDVKVIEQMICNDAKLRMLANKKFGHMVERAYIENMDKYEKIVYTLFRHQDYFLTREMYCRINEGESMNSICSKYSVGWEKATLGVVGPSPMNQLNSVLATKLRAAPLGELIQPFKVNDIWLMARKEFFQSAKLDQNLSDRIAIEMLLNQLANSENE